MFLSYDVHKTGRSIVNYGRSYRMNMRLGEVVLHAMNVSSSSVKEGGGTSI